MIETNRIELKRELTRELDLEREVVAFLNEIVDENGQKNVLENCVQIVDNDVSVGSCSEIKWPEKWPEKAQKIIVMIKENQYTTIADFEKELGIGHTTVKKILRELQENGFISRIGPDKGGKWQVIDKNIESLNS